MGYRYYHYNPSRSRYQQVFGYSTGDADRIVKEIFFSLSGKGLDWVLNKYGEKYGKGPKAYARATIPKWRDNRVTMSNEIVGRLLDFLPPLMSPAQKNRVVESIWRAHASVVSHELRE